MIKIENFLVDGKGSTMTSMNHLCNLAKEEIKSCESLLENIRFYKTNVELINGEKKLISDGNVPDDIDGLINKIAHFHAFIAYFREAIKYKENLMAEVKSYSLESYCQDNGIDMPKAPELSASVSKDDVLAEKSIDWKQNYYFLQAASSAYGKQIHPNMPFANARKEFYNIMRDPICISGQGRDALIYSYEAIKSEEEVERIFFQLQNTQREYDKQFHALEYELDTEVTSRYLAVRYEYDENMKTYLLEISKLNNLLEIYKTEELSKIQSLKICIPNRLKETYDYLNSLGK